MSKEHKPIEITDDTWINTQCGRCYACCGIRVHRVNGVAVKIEGNPETYMGSRGGVCGKGASGLQVLYDPNRLDVPLRRTNPEKGLFVDPKWKEISWDEALSELTERIKKILADDPRKILLQGTTIRAPTQSQAFRNPVGTMLGTPNRSAGGGGIHCGNGAHLSGGLMHASWSITPDFEYCNYAILFGAGKGHSSGHSAMTTGRLAAKARARGMKMVVFDPMCNFAGGKATEWVPLLPGTDGAIALAMCNVIVNELGIWDEQYIKNKSNGPYLIGADGKYVRDPGTGKPLVWDADLSKPRVYDDPNLTDSALDGTYSVNGIECQPSFKLLREHLKKYTPEMAWRVSTVPADTIRRIATEFAEAARVGSTININNHQLPFRPASATIFRGGEGHENSLHTCFAVALLDHLVGSADVPGGTLGWPARSLGYPGTGKLDWGVKKGEDGFVTLDRWFIPHKPWPLHEPKFPETATLQDFFTMCSFSPIWGSADQEEIYRKINLPYRIEMMINMGCNLVMSVASPELHAEFLKKMDFIVHFDLFSNETAEGFADLLLPDTSYLETATWMDGQGFFFNYPFGMEPWCYHIMQPVVKPKHQRRFIMDVMFELMDRLGKRREWNEYWNRMLALDEKNKIGLDEKISWEQLGDEALKHYFGSEHGWDWFKKHGFLKWPKKPEEAYWRHFLDARVPLYLEFMVDAGKKMREIDQKIGLSLNWNQYTPLISWFPCSMHQVKDSEYDLYCFSYRDILHTGSCTMEQPWIDEASRMNPYTYNITINADTGRRKGLKDGDVIEIETNLGRRTTGTVKLMEGQHPETLAIAACSGHWAKGQPIAKDKGTNFDILLELDLQHCDPVSLNIETCVKVKIRKVGER